MGTLNFPRKEALASSIPDLKFDKEITVEACHPVTNENLTSEIEHQEVIIRRESTGMQRETGNDIYPAKFVHEYPASEMQPSQLNWKEFCCKYGAFKQIVAGKYNYWFVCYCGSRMVDNKTSVTYHLINCCKDISAQERKEFTTLLDEYHRVNPIPKKKISEWKIMAEAEGTFKRHYNKKVYQCNCGVLMSYKKDEVLGHLINCVRLDKSLKNSFQTFIKSNRSNIRSKDSKKVKTIPAIFTANPLPKLSYPSPDKIRIVAQLEIDIAELNDTIVDEEERLKFLDGIYEQIKNGQ